MRIWETVYCTEMMSGMYARSEGPIAEDTRRWYIPTEVPEGAIGHKSMISHCHTAGNAAAGTNYWSHHEASTAGEDGEPQAEIYFSAYFQEKKTWEEIEYTIQPGRPPTEAVEMRNDHFYILS